MFLIRNDSQDNSVTAPTTLDLMSDERFVRIDDSYKPAVCLSKRDGSQVKTNIEAMGSQITDNTIDSVIGNDSHVKTHRRYPNLICTYQGATKNNHVCACDQENLRNIKPA